MHQNKENVQQQEWIAMYWFSEEKKLTYAQRMSFEVIHEIMLRSVDMQQSTTRYAKQLQDELSDLFSSEGRDCFQTLSHNQQNEVLTHFWQEVLDVRKSNYEQWRSTVYPWVLRLHELLLNKLQLNHQFAVSVYGMYRVGTHPMDTVIKIVAPHPVAGLQLQLRGSKLWDAFQHGIQLFDAVDQDGFRVAQLVYPFRECQHQALQQWTNELIQDWKREMNENGVIFPKSEPVIGLKLDQS